MCDCLAHILLNRVRCFIRIEENHGSGISYQAPVFFGSCSKVRNCNQICNMTGLERKQWRETYCSPLSNRSSEETSLETLQKKRRLSYRRSCNSVQKMIGILRLDRTDRKLNDVPFGQSRLRYQNLSSIELTQGAKFVFRNI